MDASDSNIRLDDRGEAVYLNDEGFMVVVGRDEGTGSPRECERDTSTFYTWHSRYRSPDGNERCEAPDIDDFAERHGIDLSERGSEHPVAYVARKLNEAGHVALPVSVHDHSSVVYRAGSPSQVMDGGWDSGYVGIIFVVRDRARELCGGERERIEALLESEVEEYSDWASGDCYRFEVYDTDSMDAIDYEGGFIGSDAAKSGLAEAAGGLNDFPFEDEDAYFERRQAEAEARRPKPRLSLVPMDPFDEAAARASDVPFAGIVVSQNAATEFYDDEGNVTESHYDVYRNLDCEYDGDFAYAVYDHLRGELCCLVGDAAMALSGHGGTDFERWREDAYRDMALKAGFPKSLADADVIE